MQLGTDLPEISDADWERTPASVRRLLAALFERVVTLEAEVAVLREQVGKTSRNSSKPPSSDPPGAPKPPPKPPTGRPRGGQKGHRRHERQRLPADTTVDCRPPRCAHCTHALTGTDPAPDWHQVIEIPAVLRQVTEYRLHALDCPSCGTTTVGTLPEGVTHEGFGPRLEALVALMTGRDHLSKRSTAEMLGEVFQIPMATGAVVDCAQRMAATLKGSYDEAVAAARTAPVANFDETGWRQDKHRAWLWVMATVAATAFVIHPHRSRAAAQTLRGTFDGASITDRYGAYDDLDPSRRQLCWAHLERDWQAMVERGGRSRRVGEALQKETARLFRWWGWVKAGHRDRAWLQRNLPTLQRAVRKALQAGVECGHPATAATCAEVQAHFESLWTFVRIEGVEPTNNFAERQVRDPVKWRRTSFGTDGARGSRFVERILTVVATLRQHGRNLLEFLAQARAAYLHGLPMPALLPMPP